MSANFLVVGGPISVGKSTLVNSLPFPSINELDESDELQMLLLENTYKKGRVAPEVIEDYFLEVRKNKYIEFSNTLQTYVFDRSIFETLWFARGNMSDKSFEHFKRLWKAEIDELIEEYGKPGLYILLTMNWDTFKERLFNRGREVEVKNFKDNETFFKQHIAEYEEHMTEVFEMFDLNYVKIATDNLNSEQVAEKAMEAIKEVFNA